MNAVLLAVTGGKDETSVSDNFPNYSDHVPIWQKSQDRQSHMQLSDQQINEKIIDVLCQYNDLIHSRLSMLKLSLLSRQQWITNWFDAGIDKPLEDLVITFWLWFWWLRSIASPDVLKSFS